MKIRKYVVLLRCEAGLTAGTPILNGTSDVCRSLAFSVHLLTAGTQDCQRFATLRMVRIGGFAFRPSPTLHLFHTLWR